MDTRRTPSRTDWSFLRANFNGAESIYRRSRRRKNRILREENTFLARDKLRQIAEIERFILSSQEAKIETARIQSPREDVQNTLNSWNYAAEEMCPTGTGSGDTTLLIAAHTAADTSQSSLRHSQSRAQFLFQHSVRFFTSDGRVRPHAKRRSKLILEEQLKCLRSYQPEETLRKTISTKLSGAW